MVTATLTPFSETRFERPAPQGLPVSSPTVNLSATWDDGTGAVLVCRAGDEVVSRIQAGGRKAGAGVTAVRWKPDGRVPLLLLISNLYLKSFRLCGGFWGSMTAHTGYRAVHCRGME